MNLMKRVKTQEEKDKLIAEAKKLWDSIPGEVSHLVASSEEDYLSKIADSIIVERETFTAPRELTPAELAKQDGEIMFMRMYDGRIDHGTGIAALDALTKANKEESLRKLLAPGQRAESELEGLIRSMVLKTIDNNPSAPRRGVLSLEERMLIWSEGDSDAIRFLRARIAGDLVTQREIARSLATA